MSTGNDSMSFEDQYAHMKKETAVWAKRIESKIGTLKDNVTVQELVDVTVVDSGEKNARKS